MFICFLSGLTAMSLLKVRSHQAGRRWNISGSVVGACEPFLLTLSDDGMTLWDRREGTSLQNIAVRGRVVQVVSALGDVQTGQTFLLNFQVMLNPHWLGGLGTVWPL